MAKWIEDPQGRLEVEKVTEELKLPVWKASYKGRFREFWNECWEKIENAYLKLKKSIDGKEPAITKKSGFNLEKTDSFEEDDTNKLATAKALKSLHDEVDKKTGAIKLNWDSITDKPSSFPLSEHNHNSLYYTETEVDNKFKDNILHSTGKEYDGILNNPGKKIGGKTYFDNNTKKLFLCLKNNNDISANIENFIPIDNNSLLDKINALVKQEKIIFSGKSKDFTSYALPESWTILNIVIAADNGFREYSFTYSITRKALETTRYMTFYEIWSNNNDYGNIVYNPSNLTIAKQTWDTDNIMIVTCIY